MISVNEYKNNKDLLEISYIPFRQKCNIVDIFLDEHIKSVGGNFFDIDKALFEASKICAFIQVCTNLDLSTDDDEDPLDVLLKNNLLNELIDTVRDQYDVFEKILALKIETIKDSYNAGKVLEDIQSDIRSTLTLLMEHENNK